MDILWIIGGAVTIIAAVVTIFKKKKAPTLPTYGGGGGRTDGDTGNDSWKNGDDTVSTKPTDDVK